MSPAATSRAGTSGAPRHAQQRAGSSLTDPPPPMGEGAFWRRGSRRAAISGACARAAGFRPVGGTSSRPERAWARNAPGIGEGGVAAQGYSAAAEAPQDSGSRIGRRNGRVGRDEAGASAEPTRNPGRKFQHAATSGVCARAVSQRNPRFGAGASFLRDRREPASIRGRACVSAYSVLEPARR